MKNPTELRDAARKVKLVVTDVDGVHTPDTIFLSVASAEETADFLLDQAGAILRLAVCDEDGKPATHVQYFSRGADRIEGYRFYTGDGIAVKECLRHDIPVVMMSGRKSPAMRQRAEDLGARRLQGVKDKVAAVEEIMAELGLAWEDVLFIGNDIQDLSLIRLAGFSAGPADAVPEVRGEVHYLAKAKGGEGAVREVLQFMLDAKGLWEGIVNRARTLG